MTKELTVRNLYGIRGEVTHRTDSNTIVITGINGAGKSSFINGMLHIFAHKSTKGAPDPIHEGQIEGEARYVDEELGLSFMRKWKNGKMSSVEVRALDGAKYADGTSILKDRVGTVIVDVADFLAVDENKRREMIMSKATFPEGFDFAKLSADQARVEGLRTDANAEKTRLAGALSQLVPPSKTTPDAEVSAAEIYAEIDKAQAHNLELADAAAKVARAEEQANDIEREIERLEAEIAAKKIKQAEIDLRRNEALPDVEEIDIAPLMERLNTVEETNRAVRAKAQFTKAAADLAAASTKHSTLDAQLQVIKKAKFDGLALATFPYKGLSVDDDYVLLDGTPFIHANDGNREVAAVAVAISGEHADDALRLVIIKNGDSLDPASLTKIDALLTERGFTGLIARGRPDMPALAGIDVVELADGQRAA